MVSDVGLYIYTYIFVYMYIYTNIYVYNVAEGHSLEYYHTLVSHVNGTPHFFIQVGYVDDTPIMGFNSSISKSVLKQSFMEQEESTYWSTETERSKTSMAIMTQLLPKMSGKSHTLQLMYGCTKGSNGLLSDSFFKFGYDGKDYFYLGSDQKWIMVLNVSVKIQDECGTGMIHNYFEDECVEWISRYTGNSGGHFIISQPKTKVVKQRLSSTYLLLKCWASYFYPAKIRMTWFKDGVNRTNETEYVETRPHGDGTFQKWAAIVVSSGDEEKYVCQVDHAGFQQRVNLSVDPLSLAQSAADSNVHFGLITFGVIIGMVLTSYLVWRRWNNSFLPRRFFSNFDV
ncbi:membrane protein S8 [Saimiriine betaherpesvirus 4]|uniref:Membrane protein S8 n=1 Tax=Saimiriine betaherpesvirus 4 TaxID=1535247 RepID=G8XSS8_9BETA|nr:membrane protein S8 [Saimiriine betaherpesvirus 4]AEV80875.1 membrane protein S8 [Saimiriine betaherpesvirus 4]